MGGHRLGKFSARTTLAPHVNTTNALQTLLKSIFLFNFNF